MPTAAVHAAFSSSSPTRAFGRYTLRGLLGKSDATMTWLAVDRRTEAEAMLTMPRVAPASPQALSNWLLAVRRAARLDHPNLAATSECEVYENWPYVAVDRGAGVPLDRWLSEHPRPPVDELAQWVAGVLRGLAFAHDAGAAHLDIQPHQILIDERGQARVMALAVAHGSIDFTGATDKPAGLADRSGPLDPLNLRLQRAAAERDVLACGLLLHQLLAGAPALAVDDFARAIDRLAPSGREIARLAWTTPQPVPEALRAIVDRSTSGQLRLRYRSARTFLGALSGWHEAIADEHGGPVALLLDRLRTVGHLPALPGLSARVARLTKIESQRTDEIARDLLPDMALSFELLRTLNSAQVQGTQIAGNGPVLTLRRVVALVGVDGVRSAANTLRAWPGPLDDEAGRAMRVSIDRVRLAGHVAQALRPAGYDGEVVYLVAVLQNLAGLLLRYHFADEAAQIEDLMRPVKPPAGQASTDEHAGLSREAASFAVLGVDFEVFGSAVARHWGLGDEVLHMVRRLPVDAPVRKPDGDGDMLRIVASAANEAVDGLELGSPQKVALALKAVVQRYGRPLRLDLKALHQAIQEARDTLASGGKPSAAEQARVAVEREESGSGAADA